MPPQLLPLRARRLPGAETAGHGVGGVGGVGAVLRDDSPFCSTIVLSKNWIRFPWVSGGFPERRIPGKNGGGSPRTVDGGEIRFWHHGLNLWMVTHLSMVILWLDEIQLAPL